MANGTKIQSIIRDYPLITGKERLLIWERARGLWKKRKPDPIKEIQKMRDEWERELPKLK